MTVTARCHERGEKTNRLHEHSHKNWFFKIWFQMIFDQRHIHKIYIHVNTFCWFNPALFTLPPTPPSSTSSDSEGSLSPLREVVSPKLEIEEGEISKTNEVGRVLHKTLTDSMSSQRHPINSPLISYQPVIHVQGSFKSESLKLNLFISNSKQRYLFLLERINWCAATDRGRETNFDSWRLSSSDTIAFNQSRREIVEEDTPQNQK